jgi:hypothetical protein
MSAWQPLLNLRIEHGFYAGGVCRGLSVTPTADTQRQLDRMGCVLRSHDGGTAVLADADRIGHFFDGEPLLLGFIARSSDPVFAAVTEGLGNAGDAAMLFDHAAADGELLQGRLEPLASAGWQTLLAARDRLAPPAFGLRIALADATPRQCRIRLEARALPWKYYLVGPWERDGLYVADPDAAVEFSPVSAERLPDGREVLTALSNASIALAERGGRRFQLRRRTGGADRLVVKRLPHAAAGSWGLQPDRGGGLVSEIYVHC